MCNIRNSLGCQQLVRLSDAKVQSLSVPRRELPSLKGCHEGNTANCMHLKALSLPEEIVPFTEERAMVCCRGNLRLLNIPNPSSVD